MIVVEPDHYIEANVLGQGNGKPLETNIERFAESCFLHIPFAHEAKLSIPLGSLVDIGGEPQPTENLHLTLLMADRCSDAQLATFLANLSPIMRFSIEVTGLAILEGFDGNVLVWKIDPGPSLSRLQAELHGTATNEGMFISVHSEPSRWVPHITIADKINPYINEGNLPTIKPFRLMVEKFHIGRNYDDYFEVHLPRGVGDKMFVERHAAPTHPGTGTEQQVHAGDGAGSGRKEKAGKVADSLKSHWGTVEEDDRRSASWISPDGEFLAPHRDHDTSARTALSDAGFEKVDVDAAAKLMVGQVGFIRQAFSGRNHVFTFPAKITSSQREAVKSMMVQLKAEREGINFEFDIFGTGMDENRVVSSSANEVAQMLRLNRDFWEIDEWQIRHVERSEVTPEEMAELIKGDPILQGMLRRVRRLEDGPYTLKQEPTGPPGGGLGPPVFQKPGESKKDPGRVGMKRKESDFRSGKPSLIDELNHTPIKIEIDSQDTALPELRNDMAHWMGMNRNVLNAMLEEEPQEEYPVGYIFGRDPDDYLSAFLMGAWAEKGDMLIMGLKEEADHYYAEQMTNLEDMKFRPENYDSKNFEAPFILIGHMAVIEANKGHGVQIFGEAARKAAMRDAGMAVHHSPEATYFFSELEANRAGLGDLVFWTPDQVKDLAARIEMETIAITEDAPEQPEITSEEDTIETDVDLEQQSLIERETLDEVVFGADEPTIRETEANYEIEPLSGGFTAPFDWSVLMDEGEAEVEREEEEVLITSPEDQRVLDDRKPKDQRFPDQREKQLQGVNRALTNMVEAIFRRVGIARHGDHEEQAGRPGERGGSQAGYTHVGGAGGGDARRPASGTGRGNSTVSPEGGWTPEKAVNSLEVETDLNAMELEGLIDIAWDELSDEARVQYLNEYERLLEEGDPGEFDEAEGPTEDEVRYGFSTPEGEPGPYAGGRLNGGVLSEAERERGEDIYGRSVNEAQMVREPLSDEMRRDLEERHEEALHEALELGEEEEHRRDEIVANIGYWDLSASERLTYLNVFERGTDIDDVQAESLIALIDQPGHAVDPPHGIIDPLARDPDVPPSHPEFADVDREAEFKRMTKVLNRILRTRMDVAQNPSDPRVLEELMGELSQWDSDAADIARGFLKDVEASSNISHMHRGHEIETEDPREIDYDALSEMEWEYHDIAAEPYVDQIMSTFRDLTDEYYEGAANWDELEDRIAETLGIDRAEVDQMGTAELHRRIGEVAAIEALEQYDHIEEDEYERLTDVRLPSGDTGAAFDYRPQGDEPPTPAEDILSSIAWDFEHEASRENTTLAELEAHFGSLPRIDDDFYDDDEVETVAEAPGFEVEMDQNNFMFVGREEGNIVAVLSATYHPAGSPTLRGYDIDGIIARNEHRNLRLTEDEVRALQGAPMVSMNYLAAKHGGPGYGVEMVLQGLNLAADRNAGIFGSAVNEAAPLYAKMGARFIDPRGATEGGHTLFTPQDVQDMVRWLEEAGIDLDTATGTEVEELLEAASMTVRVNLFALTDTDAVDDPAAHFRRRDQDDWQEEANLRAEARIAWLDQFKEESERELDEETGEPLPSGRDRLKKRHGQGHEGQRGREGRRGGSEPGYEHEGAGGGEPTDAVSEGAGPKAEGVGFAEPGGSRFTDDMTPTEAIEALEFEENLTSSDINELIGIAGDELSDEEFEDYTRIAQSIESEEVKDFAFDLGAGMAWANEHIGSVPERLNIAQIKALRAFKHEDYESMNALLRGETEEVDLAGETDMMWSHITEIDSVMARDDSVIPEAVKLYRAMDLEDQFERNFDQLEGEVISFDGYTSTTMNAEALRIFVAMQDDRDVAPLGGGEEPVIVEIIAPEGTRGAFMEHSLIGENTWLESEQEVLLDRGMEFRVIETGTTFMPGHEMKRITVEAIPQSSANSPGVRAVTDLANQMAAEVVAQLEEEEALATRVVGPLRRVVRQEPDTSQEDSTSQNREDSEDSEAFSQADPARRDYWIWGKGDINLLDKEEHEKMGRSRDRQARRFNKQLPPGVQKDGFAVVPIEPEEEIVERHGDHEGQEGREGQRGGSSPGYKHTGAESEGPSRRLGITSFKKGQGITREQVARDLEDFVDRIEGVQEHGMADGVFMDDREPSWYIRYQGDGETLDAAADEAEAKKQDSVVAWDDFEEGAPSRAGEWTIDLSEKKPSMDDIARIEQIVSDNGMGLTWFQSNGRLLLEVVAIPQYDNDPAVLEKLSDQVVQYLNESNLNLSDDDIRDTRVLLASKDNDYNWE